MKKFLISPARAITHFAGSSVSRAARSEWGIAGTSVGRVNKNGIAGQAYGVGSRGGKRGLEADANARCCAHALNARAERQGGSPALITERRADLGSRCRQCCVGGSCGGDVLCR